MCNPTLVGIIESVKYVRLSMIVFDDCSSM